VVEGWDLHHGGGWSASDDPAEEMRTYLYLYRHKAVAYRCASAGLKLTDARPFTGPPDFWIQLPPRDYWSPSS
jgi:hypothetical protein